MQTFSLIPNDNDGLPAGLLASLTSREWDVLLEVSKDLTNPEIANRLCLSVKSVENYRTRIGSKLGYEGPGLLARYARQHQAELKQWREIMSAK